LIDAYRACDTWTGALLCFSVVFAPWAFGATQQWSVWLLNLIGYALGALLFAKRLLARRARFRPPRHTDLAAAIAGRSRSRSRRTTRTDRALTALMVVLTVALLLYCLVAAMNARASRVAYSWSLTYHEGYLPWLPHSYERGASWAAFWAYLGLAGAFWAARDWLRGLTLKEESELQAAREAAERQDGPPQPSAAAHEAAQARRYRLPGRLYRFLTVVCFSGGLLALEGVAQRWTGSDSLLGLVQPRFNQSGSNQFGPFANRNNAAEYLNLVWPVCAGLAWLRVRERRRAKRRGWHWRGRDHLWLPPCAFLMAAAPYLILSRGGVLVNAGLLVAMGLLLAIANHGHHWRVHLGAVLVVLLIAQAAVVGGYDALLARFETMFVDDLSGRGELYENAQQMVADHPWYGTGPWTFSTIYQFYRLNEVQEWAGYAHDDWLELRITFGAVGLGLILILLAAVLLRWWFATGPPVHWIVPATIMVGMGGCLAHARFDLPFCVHSLVLTFLLWGAALTALGRRQAA
jgi:O-antigen ligase